MILVTGATGFVGSHLCALLESSGRPYRALIRSRTKAAERGLPEERCFVGDLAGDLAGAVEGVDAVVHLAGLVRAVGSGPLFRTNGEATERLVATLARHAPQARLVHISSIAATAPSEDGALTLAPPSATSPVSDYGRSKKAAELAVTVGTSPWLVLRPAIVYGPWDTDVLVMFRMLAKGRLPIIGDARYSLVHVGDLSRAILAALDSHVVGRFIPIARKGPVTQRAWAAAIATALGKAKASTIGLPQIFGATGALFSEVWSRVSRRPAFLGWDKWREARAGSWVAGTELARELLGFEAQTDHSTGFAETAAWYREHGWLD